jgi:polyisoprenyl-phosphate glycosyltransferase
MKKNVDISIIAPMYNESENIDQFYKRVTDVLKPMKKEFEIVCVNDGSRDDTLMRLYQLSKKDKRVKVVDLSRNFGKEIALTAGIDFAIGQTVVPIDSDLQDPPELIPALYHKWKEGFDVVYAKRLLRKGESLPKKITAHLFYKTIRLLSNFEIPENTGDFRLMDRQVVDALNELRETQRFMKGLFSWVGFRQTAVEYEREPRHAGSTKWNYPKLFNLAVEGITSFSHVPLRFATFLGCLVSVSAIIYALFIIIKKMLIGDPVPGYASTVGIILLIGGIQLFTIGIIGEYIGRIYYESKRRPLYFVRETYGIISAKNISHRKH